MDLQVIATEESLDLDLVSKQNVSLVVKLHFRFVHVAGRGRDEVCRRRNRIWKGKTRGGGEVKSHSFKLLGAHTCTPPLVRHPPGTSLTMDFKGGEEGETLSRNHPLQEFLRAQQRDGLLKNGGATLEDFVGSYEQHLSISGKGATAPGSDIEGSSSKAATEEDAATTVHFDSPRSSNLSTIGRVDDYGLEKAYAIQSQSPGNVQLPQHIDSIVLKFTTLSDACSEAPSYTITTAGATIGRAESNDVSVPSDSHLAEVGHANIEFVNGNFFLVDGGCDFPASIRIGTGTRIARWHLETDARFSAGSSTFRSRGINEVGELVLDVIEGPLKGECRVIGREGAAIGRASDNKLSVPDRELSRRHSAIEYDTKTGQYLLVDSGSTNGTYMQLVGPYSERYQLTLSDHILVGRTGFSINRFDYGLSEEMGHRQTMEDACVIVQRLAVASLRCSTLSPQSFFGVYDGHGGAEASAYLSKHLHVNVADGLAAMAAELVQAKDDEARLDALVLQTLKATFLKTDGDFLANATPAHAQHGSTATTGLLLGQRLYCANVGDSRTLLCR